MNNDYEVHQFDFVEKNQSLYTSQCLAMHQALTRTLQSQDTTKDYWKYNFFSLSSSSVAFYKLWKELNRLVRNYVADDRPLWMSGWLNCHSYNQVLDWHSHKLSLVHGYISIDPKDTVTEFEDYKIINKPGQIYLGPSERMHRVVNNKFYPDYRITIAFDVSDRCDVDHINSNFYAFIPVF